MHDGDGLSNDHIRQIAHVVTRHSLSSGVHLSVFIGSPNGPARPFAQRLLAALGDRAPGSVLILVAPAERQLEIVSGRQAARVIDDRSCELAALAMTSSFAVGDLAGGVIAGLQVLVEEAVHLRSLEA